MWDSFCLVNFVVTETFGCRLTQFGVRVGLIDTQTERTRGDDYIPDTPVPVRTSENGSDPTGQVRHDTLTDVYEYRHPTSVDRHPN